MELQFWPWNFQGLDQHEAITRLEDHGVNAPICGRKESEFLKLLKNLIGFHNGPLWIAAVLCFTVYLTEYYFNENDLEVKPDNVSWFLDFMLWNISQL